MPHILIKLGAGRSEQQKHELTARLTQTVLDVLHCDDAEISIAIEDVPRDDWMAQVYASDIQAKADTLYKRPGYGPNL
jgi:4-oxalocrotonate tautomerase